MSGAGSTALITGASSGIGATFARQVAARGCDLILVARRRDKLEQLAGELAGLYKVRVESIATDLTVDEDVAAVEGKIRETSNLDLLINNAGFGSRGRFWETDPAGQRQMHSLHILATLRLTQAALPGMVRRGRGGIINVSSVAGFGATPGSASYCATKAWMNTFTEAIALELESAGSRVRVQALCPGFTHTEFHDAAGMDRGVIPRGWWMAAEQVVAESLRGLDNGMVFVVPGLRYKLLVLAMTFIPRFLRHAGVRVYSRRMKRV